jgi:hypothetical protein
MKPDVPLMPPYLTYVMRLWRMETEDGPIWRVVLDNPYSAERRGFATLGELHQFLTEKTGAPVYLPSGVETDHKIIGGEK